MLTAPPMLFIFTACCMAGFLSCRRLIVLSPPSLHKACSSVWFSCVLFQSFRSPPSLHKACSRVCFSCVLFQSFRSVPSLHEACSRVCVFRVSCSSLSDHRHGVGGCEPHGFDQLSLCLCVPLSRWVSGQTSAWRAADWGSLTVPGPAIPVTSYWVIRCLSCPASGIVRSVLELAGPLSECCDWMRRQV